MNADAKSSETTPRVLDYDPASTPCICLASTSGGHLYQLSRLRPALQNARMYLVTVESPVAVSIFPGIRLYQILRIHRNPAGFVMNFLQSALILLREKPSVILTTGAGDALPTTILGAALGVPVVFIESVARVRNPSLFGRLVSRFASMTIVQWAPVQGAYRSAILTLPLIRPSSATHRLPETPSIVVLTGTHTRGFERLLRAVDTLLADGRLKARVFAQVGHSTYTPVNYTYQRFLPHEILMDRVRAADVVVTHDGSGSIADGLFAGKPVLVVPRNPKEGEVSYRSTSELAHHLASLDWITIVEDPYAIPDAIRQVNRHAPRSPENLPEVADIVRIFLQSLHGGSRRGTKSVHSDGMAKTQRGEQQG